MLSRRVLIVGAAGWLATPRESADTFSRAVANLERRHGGRLGVAVLNTATQKRAVHRGDERFPMCSTAKLLAAAFVLARVDRGQDSLTRRVIYEKCDLVGHSPTTELHLGNPGLPLGEIVEAALTLSDNCAMNLMLKSFGGPNGLTVFLRSIGDRVTRRDRQEPALNEALPGDARDTTTPSAMLGTLQKLLLGPTLYPPSWVRLNHWLVANQTGDNRLRAGVPRGWKVGDKTGTGANGATNDVAIAWPPNRSPLVVAAFYVGAHATDSESDAILAEVGCLASSI